MTTDSAPAAFAGWPPPVLDPAGPFAGPVTVVSWALFVIAVAVTVLVTVTLGLALFGPRRWRKRVATERLVIGAGFALPVLVLSALLIWGLSLTARLDDPPRPGEMHVRVTGEMWWWRVAYLDGAGQETMQDANEIYIPVGETVVFELEAADVIHSFWIPRLGGKEDMVPGRRNVLRLQADKPGVYAGQCAEFCGGPHALMGFVVVALPRPEFDAWKARREMSQAPAALAASRGAQVFVSAGCGACHTVRGTPANGLAGPDLTFVGSRRTLGAGILPNNEGALAGWVSDSQAIKPGNRMPAYPVLRGEELRAVSAYLAGLR